jgi:hypothetical protein
MLGANKNFIKKYFDIGQKNIACIFSIYPVRPLFKAKK